MRRWEKSTVYERIAFMQEGARLDRGRGKITLPPEIPDGALHRARLVIQRHKERSPALTTEQYLGELRWRNASASMRMWIAAVGATNAASWMATTLIRDAFAARTSEV